MKPKQFECGCYEGPSSVHCFNCAYLITCNIDKNSNSRGYCENFESSHISIVEARKILDLSQRYLAMTSDNKLKQMLEEKLQCEIRIEKYKSHRGKVKFMKRRIYKIKRGPLD